MTDQELVINAAIALVAFASLFVAVWEGIANRRHNRLSLMPLLLMRLHLGGTKGRYGITVDNDGLGPARITRCLLAVDGKNLEGGWEEALPALGLADFGNGLTYETIVSGVIPARDEVWLISIPVNDEEKDRIAVSAEEKAQVKSRFAKALNRLGVTIYYESMYGERYINAFDGTSRN